jgi:CMP/dCMP kinase
VIVAIDGPAASGKGTLAKRMAAALGLPHLDTGLLYRAVARAVLDGGHAIEDRDAAVDAARRLALDGLDEHRLRGREMGEAASIVAAVPDVRSALLEAQRSFAAQPAGAVLDGRDIGTVICPDADVKLFVVATAEIRAQRRHLELQGRGEASDFADVLADIRRRDERDAGRGAAPLKAAADATILDTSALDVDAAFDAAMAILSAHAGHAHRNAGRVDRMR